MRVGFFIKRPHIFCHIETAYWAVQLLFELFLNLNLIFHEQVNPKIKQPLSQFFMAFGEEIIALDIYKHRYIPLIPNFFIDCLNFYVLPYLFIL